VIGDSAVTPAHPNSAQVTMAYGNPARMDRENYHGLSGGSAG
jgi:hypothetical protein